MQRTSSKAAQDALETQRSLASATGFNVVIEDHTKSSFQGGGVAQRAMRTLQNTQ